MTDARPNPLRSTLLKPTPLGIYISVPFCRAKCSYCNFASGVFTSQQMDSYVDHLVEEIRSVHRWAQSHSAILPHEADSVYFGGGTPSILRINHLGSIVKAIRDSFALVAQAEITLECAPGQISEPLLGAFGSLGINRVSLGVQSFVDLEASAVGRLHTRALVLEEIVRLRSAGIEEINVDLIAGLPHQTPESWQTSLDVAIESGVPHLSVYMLDVDEDSRLGREMLAGGARYGAARVPEESAIAAMYGEACERFAAVGIPQYEISNFARPGHESRHNLKYWTREPYVGFGLDAHSFLPVRGGHAIRAATTDDLPAYLSQGVLRSVTQVSNIEALEEAWFLGLRLSRGVSLKSLEQEFGRSLVAQFEPVWHGCEREGLTEHSEDCVRLTARGRLFGNEVFARFLGVVHEELEGGNKSVRLPRQRTASSGQAKEEVRDRCLAVSAGGTSVPVTTAAEEGRGL